MRYFSRAEVEKIGKAGAYYEDNGDTYKTRILSSYWLCVEKDDNAFTPWVTVKKDNFWEAWITKWVSEELDNADVFIDVGANVGYYSMMAGVAGVKTYAIEPNPYLEQLLKSSIEFNKLSNVELITKAVGSRKRAKAPLCIPYKHSGAAYIGKEAVDNSRVVDISIDTLDNLFKDMSGQNILVKVDAEGSEPHVWKGSKALRQNNSVTWVLEWQRDRKGSQTFLQELLDLGPVYVVDYEGTLQEVSYDKLNSSDELRMIVSK